jgi:hypothetical protein
VLLEEYLNQLLSKQNLYNCPLLLEFIQMEKEHFMLLSKCPTHIGHKSDTNLKTYLPKKKSYDDLIQMKKANSDENKVDNYFYDEFTKKEEKIELINEFLMDLEKNEEDKCSNINKFWVYLTKKWPTFTKEEIMKLFYGDGNSLKGLLFHCGKVSENSIGSQSCLDLLSKLIRYDYNPDCEKFLAVIKMGRLENIKRMKLEFHLKSAKNSVLQNCFAILKEVINKERGIDLSKILNDVTAENKFTNWIGFKDAL